MDAIPASYKSTFISAHRASRIDWLSEAPLADQLEVIGSVSSALLFRASELRANHPVIENSPLNTRCQSLRLNRETVKLAGLVLLYSLLYSFHSDKKDPKVVHIINYCS